MHERVLLVEQKVNKSEVVVKGGVQWGFGFLC